MNPCPVLSIQTARDFLQMVVQQRRAGVRVLEHRPRDDLVREAQALAAAGPSSPQAQVRYDAGEVIVGYKHDGRAYRETLSTLVTFTQMGVSTVGGTSAVIAVRAPGAADRAAIGAQTARDLGAMNDAAFQQRMDGMDRMQRNNIDTIYEQQRYVDPATGQHFTGSIHAPAPTNADGEELQRAP